MTRLLIIGGSDAGISAALRAREVDPAAMDAQAAKTYLEAALEVSDGAAGDDATILLNPRIVAPDSEWEACFFVSWRREQKRYRSFAALMRARAAHRRALCYESTVACGCVGDGAG